MYNDDPQINDNRSYQYAIDSRFIRSEYFPILDFVDLKEAKIIDLGCGDGTLLELLRKEKKAQVQGVELSSSGVASCQQKNIECLHTSIDGKLPFQDLEFDFSICNVTLQMVQKPEVLIKEMQRISKNLIVSFPNFAYYKNRLELLLNGVMPKTMLFGYDWYSTGHIHQLSIKDFLNYVKSNTTLRIETQFNIKPGISYKDLLIDCFPNLFSQTSIFLLKND